MLAFFDNPFVLTLGASFSSLLVTYVLAKLLGHRIVIFTAAPDDKNEVLTFIQNLEDVDLHGPITLTLAVDGPRLEEPPRLRAGPNLSHRGWKQDGQGRWMCTVEDSLRGNTTWTVVSRPRRTQRPALTLAAPESTVEADASSQRGPWELSPPLGWLTVPALLVAALTFYFSVTRLLFKSPLTAERTLPTSLTIDGAICLFVVAFAVMAYWFARHPWPTPIVAGYKSETEPTPPPAP